LALCTSAVICSVHAHVTAGMARYVCTKLTLCTSLKPTKMSHASDPESPYQKRASYFRNDRVFRPLLNAFETALAIFGLVATTFLLAIISEFGDKDCSSVNLFKL
ncbi:hypothetical protein DL93DRAFT_2070794, partial [Clavulina sp. PMI_390]